MGAGIAEEMPTRSLAAHPHQHSWSIPVPSSPRPSGGMIKAVTPSWLFLRTEGFAEKKNPVPHLNSTALTSRTMEARVQWGQLQVLAGKGTRLGG